MMDPGMGAAPMPPAGPPMGADPMAMAAAPKPIELVLAALSAWGQERSAEQDALLAAVMAATGGMPSGAAGVSEGAPFGAPPMGGAPMPAEGGAY